MTRRRRRNPNARRHQTTRAGRRGETVVDLGTPEARAHRLRATGDAGLPFDPLGILLGHARLSQELYNTGRDIGDDLEVARGETVPGPWLTILAGGPLGGRPGAADVSPAAERAWRRLERIRAAIGEPWTTALVLQTCAGEFRPCEEGFIGRLWARQRWTPRDRAVHARLLAGLDRVARSWSRGRAA
jgi:hypothetical protein